MKTGIAALNELLFEQLERVTNDDLGEEEFEREIKRSKATADIAKTIIANNSLALEAKKHLDEYGQGEIISLPFLGEK